MIPKGFKHSEETKEKIRQANFRRKYKGGWKLLEETKKKISNFAKQNPFLKKFKKGCIPWNKGTKGLVPSEEKHCCWKGNNVGYRALHFWVQKHLGKPDSCEICNKSDLIGKQIHWANKSGEYKREISDWVRLCVQCHKVYDQGRKNIIKNNL